MFQILGLRCVHDASAVCYRNSVDMQAIDAVACGLVVRFQARCIIVRRTWLVAVDVRLISPRRDSCTMFEAVASDSITNSAVLHS